MRTYGTPNAPYVQTWPGRDDDQAMYALNLMRYRPRAEYPDGRPTTLSGREADDLYAPREELAAVGAMPVMRAGVVHQLVGDGARWDRVAVARYPRRLAMLEMQQLPAFKERHVHKVAGLDFTIVLATFRVSASPPPEGADEAAFLLLQVVGDRNAPDLAQGLDAAPIGTFDVEDTIIGDERRYAQARWHVITPAVANELARRERVADPGAYAFVLAPDTNQLAASMRA